MTEEWRDIPGFGGRYQVSSAGRVRAPIWVTADGKTTKARMLTANSTSGYPRVNLIDPSGRKLPRPIHRLMLMAFDRLPEAGEVACHRDDDPRNNTLENLYWGTRSDNERDKGINGRNPNANKTECHQGHPYDEVNTVQLPGGRRDCRACKRARNRAYEARFPRLNRRWNPVTKRNETVGPRRVA